MICRAFLRAWRAGFCLEKGICELASPGRDVYIPSTVLQASELTHPSVSLDCLPRYRPNGETGRRMGLKIPRS